MLVAFTIFAVLVAAWGSPALHAQFRRLLAGRRTAEGIHGEPGIGEPVRQRIAAGRGTSRV
jgi:hypothetical protein